VLAMGTVTVNAPKTPVTKGSNGTAIATLPNICKMPGPPAPFVPTPLPNIGTSDNSPQGYSISVTTDGDPVAIKGATFASKGDIASQGTGGGLVSSNVQGPTSFVGPGSMDVKIEGKNVQLLSDPMLSNGGPSGSPANAATMAGLVQAPGATALEKELLAIAKQCHEDVEGKKASKKKGCTARGREKHKCCESKIKGKDPPLKNVASEFSHEKAPGCRLDVAVFSGLPHEPANVAKIYDFKFNCAPNKPKMSGTQERKYLSAFKNLTTEIKLIGVT
jgi:hypothetical protein